MVENSEKRTMNDRDNPGVIVPPPLIFLGVLLAGILADSVFGTSTLLPAAARYALAAVLIGSAFVFLAGALGQFRSAKTRPEPWQPTTSIVTDGVYRYTRNPMYLGMALAYAGLALINDSLVSLMLLAPLLAVIDSAVIRREERYLQHKFRDEYMSYKSRVRRWI